VKQKRIVNIW